MARETLPRVVTLRLSEPLHDAIKTEAADAGLTPAGWLRKHLIDMLGESTKADAQRSKPRRQKKAVPADVQALSRLQAAVAMNNGALVQLAKAFRLGGASYDHAETERVLGDLRRVAVEIRKTLKQVKEA
ncbi:hypothetical protein ACM64Y_14905 [Novispirillum sp. DQ9]|uniref:hypothetical protein n=1 Tax=Novispirillum sp. DQ9 TaxID=3398612 RepID=UPI003C7A86CA